ncbi:D-alanyl-D-alanine carboxypeptidase/D-alanyl-D-alanine-endopeptidase [Actinosynnema sp. NPDC047251]|uniref:D-alanyl-D-alanine carboxypeptidase/D-alanyl-D-alanine endopeptidase n=1 Tax=Saccharothrix espanaensis TaxID=103731 RepID=UPI0011DD5CE8|nr:D-alanyl-D-alanine carboxypeptidase/D-alanyl-D-alanine-endopeptidase [Saccharothrix espanaensis]
MTPGRGVPLGPQTPARGVPLGPQTPGRGVPLGPQTPGRGVPLGARENGPQTPGRGVPPGSPANGPQTPARGVPLGAQPGGAEAAGASAAGVARDERKVEPEPRSEPKRVPPADDGVVEEAPRKRPWLLVGALALVVVLAGGAVVGWQQGWLDTAPTPTTAAPQPPAPISLAVKGIGATAPAPSATGVGAALRGPANNGALGTLTGTVVDPASGTTLWKQGETTPLTPASTVKVLVAAAALLTLDHTAQLSTKVVQGDQPGTVVLVGGGDPTLSTFPVDRGTVYPGAATLDDLASQVTKNGPVTQVLFDVSRYRGEGMAPGWDPTDVPNGYVAPIGPLMADGGRQDPTLPDTPRSATPGAAAASALAARLGVTAVGAGTATAGAKVLGEVKSAPVDRLVENMMQISDNVLAETLAREVALAKGQEPTFAGAVAAVRAVLTENGFDLTGAEVVDASGLSPTDKVPARLLGDLLVAAAKPDAADARTAKLRPLLTALPVAGGSGTLAGRYDTAGAAGKGWVRAKTGTLTGVNSLAGVVVDVDGRLLVFAFMSLSPTDANTVRGGLDELASALRGCGCA